MALSDLNHFKDKLIEIVDILLLNKLLDNGIYTVIRAFIK